MVQPFKIMLGYIANKKSEAEDYVAKTLVKYTEDIVLEEGKFTFLCKETLILKRGSKVKGIKKNAACDMSQVLLSEEDDTIPFWRSSYGTLTCLAKKRETLFALTAQHNLAKTNEDIYTECFRFSKASQTKASKTVMLSTSSSGLLRTWNFKLSGKKQPLHIDIAEMPVSCRDEDNVYPMEPLTLGEVVEEDRVHKYGAETEKTNGKIIDSFCKVKIPHGDEGYAFLVQSARGSFANHGDSGSLILNEDHKAIGILQGNLDIKRDGISSTYIVCLRLDCCLHALAKTVGFKGTYKLYAQAIIEKQSDILCPGCLGHQ